jgi:hypothetical protein
MTVTVNSISDIVKEVVDNTPITDIHTHLYAPHFQELMLAGIDELLTYHYLIAEVMRESNISYDEFWKLSKIEQADLIWTTLFVENTPYSEACRGIVTVLKQLGVDLSTKNLEQYREQLRFTDLSAYVDEILAKAGVESVVMTNDPFDPVEGPLWDSYSNDDPRFHAVLRIDPLLNEYEKQYTKLQGWGYDVKGSLDEKTLSEVRRFVSDWIEKMNALYVAVSLPNTFVFPEESTRAQLIQEVILPVCREKNIPFAMMIGVKRAVNPALQSAGDSLGKSSIEAVEYLCQQNPNNKFLVTMLSRENQHELAVAARKFRNLMVFGCWWFLNNPSLIEEITTMRFELLGSSVIPQHSDARILDQLVYKWQHSREIITKVLTEKYEDLIASGWHLEKEEIERDAAKLFGGNFWRFLEKEL